MKKTNIERECLAVGKTKGGASCAIYGHEILDPNADKHTVVGWRFYRGDGIEQGENEEGVQVPVRSKYAAEEVAKAMMYAYGDGHETGRSTGANEERRKVRDVMELLCSPLVEAIARNCPHI